MSSNGIMGSEQVHELFAAQSDLAIQDEFHSQDTNIEDDASLDYDATPSEVISRIESLTMWLIQQLAQGKLPDLDISSTATAATSTTSSHANVLSLAGRHPEAADRYARLWHVLHLSHELLTNSQTATQRELHYRLLKPTEVFYSHGHISAAIQDAVRLLQVPRSSLGISASGKGLIAGHLALQNTLTGEIINCNTPNGVTIPGDISLITNNWAYQSTAQCILIVEKETVFKRLISAGFPDMIPNGGAIVVTGKGVPDLATRVFISALQSALPLGAETPILGLVDWNPAGVGILSIYRWGSSRMTESVRYCLPSLKWLGARASMLSSLEDGRHFQELSARDKSLIPNLTSRMAGGVALEWVQELETMVTSNSKADLEAVYEGCGSDGFAGLIADCIAAGDWV